MSQLIAQLLSESKKKNHTRDECLALVADLVYQDGRTKQCHVDECDINKIMRRFESTQTITHLAKYEGVYADFSDFDFHEQTNKLAAGNEIFANLPAEIRREFGQSPSEFFAYVNDPKNAKDLREKLPGLNAPGDQLPPEPPSADAEAAQAAKALPAQAAKAPPAHSEPLATPRTPAGTG